MSQDKFYTQGECRQWTIYHLLGDYIFEKHKFYDGEGINPNSTKFCIKSDFMEGDRYYTVHIVDEALEAQRIYLIVPISYPENSWDTYAPPDNAGKLGDKILEIYNFPKVSIATVVYEPFQNTEPIVHFFNL